MFYENFAFYCTKIGKSESAVAKDVGITSKSVTGWKNGALPRNSTLKKLADYFGVTVDELMGTKKEPAGQGGLTEDMKEILEYAQKMGPDERKAFLTLLKSNSKK